MIRWLLSLFAWRLHEVHACWIYEQNAVTGQRRVWTADGAGYAPLDWPWLLSGAGMPLIDGIPAWRSAYRNSLPDGWYWG